MQAAAVFLAALAVSTTAVDQKSLTLLPGVGLVLSSSGLLGRHREHFIDADRIDAVIINEVS